MNSSSRKIITRYPRFKVDQLNLLVLVKSIYSRSNCYWFKATDISHQGIGLRYSEKGHVPFIMGNALSLTIDISGSVFERPVNLQVAVRRSEYEGKDGRNLNLYIGTEIISIDQRQKNIWNNGLCTLGRPLELENFQEKVNILVK